jgi:hypothetical protein
MMIKMVERKMKVKKVNRKKQNRIALGFSSRSSSS